MKALLLAIIAVCASCQNETPKTVSAAVEAPQVNPDVKVILDLMADLECWQGPPRSTIGEE